MNNNCFKIVQYAQEKIIFNVSEIWPDNHLATCTDFGKVIYYGEYECVDKSNNTYYALNDNNDNADIIENNIEITNNNLDKSNEKNSKAIEFTKDYDETKEFETSYPRKYKNTHFLELTNDYVQTENLNNNYAKNNSFLSINDSCTFGTINNEETVNELFFGKKAKLGLLKSKTAY